MHEYETYRTSGAGQAGAQIDGVQPIRAVIVVGHGSLRPDAGAAMIRLAERAHDAGVAPIVVAGFLNYSQPTFAQALAQCVAGGATEVVVQPYFLVPGKFVREDLVRLLEANRRAHPSVSLRLAEPFGDHPALARLLLKRAIEADERTANPQRLSEKDVLPLDEGRETRDGSCALRPSSVVLRPARLTHTLHRTGMLIMAHGSPNARSNRPIYAVARRVRASRRYAAVKVCFLDLNRPSIPDAIAAMAARGIRRVVAMPYFLQLGRHVADDLPAIIGAARERHPDTTLVLAEHLAYDQLLVSVIADRVAEALAAPLRSTTIHRSD
jgi:sirohydrochlorin cobaltochelatase